VASHENSKRLRDFCVRPHNPRTRHERDESCNRAVRAPASAPSWMAAPLRMRRPRFRPLSSAGNEVEPARRLRAFDYRSTTPGRAVSAGDRGVETHPKMSSCPFTQIRSTEQSDLVPENGLIG
jgi:hypothetical protein